MSTLIRLPEGSVCWPVSALSSAAQDVRHAHTRVLRSTTGERTVGGMTRWERRYADVSAWVEWDWVEMNEGTVVQADPLNERAFWTTIYPKLVALTIAGDPTNPLAIVSRIELVSGDNGTS